MAGWRNSDESGFEAWLIPRLEPIHSPPAPFQLQIQSPPGEPSAGLLLQAGPESDYWVEWWPELDTGSWNLLQDIPSLQRSPHLLSDATPAGTVLQRFYRAVLLTP